VTATPTADRAAQPKRNAPAGGLGILRAARRLLRFGGDPGLLGRSTYRRFPPDADPALRESPFSGVGRGRP